MRPKPRIAFFDFTGCEGCQLTVIDSLENHPELLDAVDIVQFREAMSEKDDDFSIAFIEGSCTRSSDEKRLTKIREQAGLVIALGACAHLGGVNAVRNVQPLESVRRCVYGEKAEVYETSIAKPIGDVISIDGFIPGCPIDPEEFIRGVKRLLQGNRPLIPDYPVCVECKLRENACLFQRGKMCLGPITRAGCGALCPNLGVGCEGCRGLIPNPNITWLKEIMAEQGQSAERISARMGLFMTNQILESEVFDVES